MKIPLRSLLVFFFDLAAVAVAWLGGFLIRFNFDWPAEYNGKVLLGLAVLLAIHAAACRWAGLYRGMWLFASLPDTDPEPPSHPVLTELADIDPDALSPREALERLYQLKRLAS